MHDGGPPPNKWNFSANITAMSSGDVLDLLNEEFDSGNTTVVYAECADGKFLFFGNYKR